MSAFPLLDLEEGKEGCKGAGFLFVYLLVCFFPTEYKLQEKIDGPYSTTLAREFHNGYLERWDCTQRPLNHKES